MCRHCSVPWLRVLQAKLSGANEVLLPMLRQQRDDTDAVAAQAKVTALLHALGEYVADMIRQVNASPDAVKQRDPFAVLRM